MTRTHHKGLDIITGSAKLPGDYGLHGGTAADQTPPIGPTYTTAINDSPLPGPSNSPLSICQGPTVPRRYLCERCGGTGRCDDDPARICRTCHGSGELGIVGEALTAAEIRKRAEWEPGAVQPVAEVLTVPNGLPPGAIGEYQFCSRKWRFDWAWPWQKIALEIEGGAWKQGRHNRPKGFIRDMEKYNQAAIMGWRIIRVTPQQFSSGEAGRLVHQAMKTQET